MKQSENKAQRVKDDLKRIDRYRRIRWTAKKIADEQIKRFLGIHLFTSEPHGLVF